VEHWLDDLDRQLAARADATGMAPAPFAPNLIVHRSNTRLADDLAVVLRHAPALVITSVGSPAPVVPALHDAGAQVVADVATIRHAERALEAGRTGSCC